VITASPAEIVSEQQGHRVKVTGRLAVSAYYISALVVSTENMGPVFLPTLRTPTFTSWSGTSCIRSGFSVL
jgi:hypothetical protein